MTSISAEIPANTPVLVGVGITEQRSQHPKRAKEAYCLMAEALQAAAVDAGSQQLLSDCELMMVPQGTWNYSDPARLIADKVGAINAKTVYAKVGILQQTLLGDACRRITEGEVEVAVVTGGEAKYRQLLADIQGIDIEETLQADVPDEVMEPQAEMFLDVEAQAGLFMPVGYYALIESALRYHQGTGIEEHRDYLAAMYSRFSEIASSNPHAWKSQQVDAQAIRNPSTKNKMLAFPYTKLHTSAWNVDQASALIFCSAAKAEALGVPRDKWIYPQVSVESNQLVHLAERRELHRSVGAEIAAQKALAHAGITAQQLDFIDLYSCFPACVQIYANALGVAEHQDYSFSGAMPFAGGPLNNYVLQSTCRLVELLRSKGVACGLVSSTSGLIYKQGFGIFSTKSCAAGFKVIDVTCETKARDRPLEVVENYRGEGRIAACTVLFQGEQPERAVVVCDLSHDRRTVAYSQKKSVMEGIMSQEYCGRPATIADGRFTVK